MNKKILEYTVSHEYLKIRACKHRIMNSLHSRNGSSKKAIDKRTSDSLNLNILVDNHKYTLLYGVA